MAQREWSVENGKDERGGVPVVDFLRGVRAAGSQPVTRIIRNIDRLRDEGLALGRQFIAKMDPTTKGAETTFELRTRWKTNEYRVMFYNPEGRTLVLLHGFLKKTNAVPVAEIQRAETLAALDRSRRKGRKR